MAVPTQQLVLVVLLLTLAPLVPAIRLQTGGTASHISQLGNVDRAGSRQWVEYR